LTVLFASFVIATKSPLNPDVLYRNGLPASFDRNRQTLIFVGFATALFEVKFDLKNSKLEELKTLPKMP